MTFNIRYGNAPDGLNSWFWRRSLLMETIRSHFPDIIGMQEVITSQEAYITDGMPDYEFYGVGRDNGLDAGERCTILFKKSKFVPLDRGTFWLSPTPEIVGSKGWDAALPRIASWLKLEHRESGDRWLVLNTHFDHQGNKARSESVKLIRQKIDSMGSFDKVILLGDFNFNETSSAYQELVKNSYQVNLTDAYRTIEPVADGNEGTYHGFLGTTYGRPIDMIWLSSGTTLIDAFIDRSHEGSRYPSDHYPVIAIID